MKEILERQPSSFISVRKTVWYNNGTSLRVRMAPHLQSIKKNSFPIPLDPANKISPERSVHYHYTSPFPHNPSPPTTPLPSKPPSKPPSPTTQPETPHTPSPSTSPSPPQAPHYTPAYTPTCSPSTPRPDRPRRAGTRARL